jgi:hypothetical protein
MTECEDHVVPKRYFRVQRAVLDALFGTYSEAQLPIKHAERLNNQHLGRMLARCHSFPVKLSRTSSMLIG